jgi:rRNA-processing protein FCF1
MAYDPWADFHLGTEEENIRFYKEKFDRQREQHTIDELNKIKDSERIFEERKQRLDIMKSNIGNIFTLQIKDVASGSSVKPLYGPQMVFYTDIFTNQNENIPVYVDYNLLKNIEVGAFADIMIIDVKRVGSYLLEGFIGIPSPIKNEHKTRWYEILHSKHERKQIKAKIHEINNYGFILNVGCELYPLWNYPKKYMKDQKVGDLVDVKIKDINFNSYFIQITLEPPLNLNNLKNEYINNTIKNKSNIFIFDTNAIMDFYNMLKQFIDLNKQIIIPFNVLEELDGKKNCTNEEKSYKARNGLKAINELMNIIKFESPSNSVLPQGMDKQKNDNQILSVAIINKEKNPIIITNDIGIKIKAKSLNIEVWDLSEEFEKEDF